MSYNNGDQKPLNNTITIESVEDKPNAIKLKGHDNKSYSFWKTKKDGSYTSAYEQFNSMGLKAGITVNVSYVIETFTLPNGRQGASNKVIWFREAGGRTETPRSEPNKVSSGQSERNWEKEAYEKCCSIWVAAIIQHSGIQQLALEVSFEQFWQIFQAIKKDGEKRFTPTVQGQAEIEYPEDEPLPEEIPF